MLITDPGNTAFVSAVSIAELRIKQSIGKLILPIDFSDLIEQTGYEILPLAAEHAHMLLELPFHHRDPFDRMLIAQAMVEELTLLSSDGKFRLYDVNVIAN